MNGRHKVSYSWPGSNSRPSACEAVIIATRPQLLMIYLDGSNSYQAARYVAIVEPAPTTAHDKGNTCCKHVDTPGPDAIRQLGESISQHRGVQNTDCCTARHLHPERTQPVVRLRIHIGRGCNEIFMGSQMQSS